ncbi:DUF3310 domain-containing protein [uncultured Corynebacterium sp.]|uniref:DUF3310 domain-containing protein n=1 Tax=uncultured Corynebacterium sp. TaxID=159447 RepID=UPI00260DEE11|nr:DUF3310 domain-containing protein [uncultured Corynebacterium sp.]
MTNHKAIHNPAHYQTSSGLEAIDVIDAFFHDNYALGNVFKYIARAGKKGDTLEDLGKAQWYLNHAILLENREDKEIQGVPL